MLIDAASSCPSSLSKLATALGLRGARPSRAERRCAPSSSSRSRGLGVERRFGGLFDGNLRVGRSAARGGSLIRGRARSSPSVRARCQAMSSHATSRIAAAVRVSVDRNATTTPWTSLSARTAQATAWTHRRRSGGPPPSLPEVAPSVSSRSAWPGSRAAIWAMNQASPSRRSDAIASRTERGSPASAQRVNVPASRT